jgi:hypothetical protein
MGTKQPAGRDGYAVTREETLPDGRRRLTLKNGAVIYAPPVPGGDWTERTARAICHIQYEAIRK